MRNHETFRFHVLVLAGALTMLPSPTPPILQFESHNCDWDLCVVGDSQQGGISRSSLTLYTFEMVDLESMSLILKACLLRYLEF